MPFQRVGVVGEAYAVLLDDIAGSAHGSGSVVAVLGNLVAGSCHHEASAGGYVEGVLSVAARTHNVDGAIGGEVDGKACLHQCFAETDKLVHGDAPHLEGSEQGCYLRLRIHFLGDVEEDLFGLLRRKLFVVEETGEYCFHLFIYDLTIDSIYYLTIYYLLFELLCSCLKYRSFASGMPHVTVRNATCQQGRSVAFCLTKCGIWLDEVWHSGR